MRLFTAALISSLLHAISAAPANIRYDQGSTTVSPDVSSHSRRTTFEFFHKFVDSSCTDDQRQKIIQAWADAKQIASAQVSQFPNFNYDIPHTRWLGKDWNSNSPLGYRDMIQGNFRRLDGILHDYAEDAQAAIYYSCKDLQNSCKDVIAYQYEDLHPPLPHPFYFGYVVFCPLFFNEEYKKDLQPILAAMKYDSTAQMVVDNYYNTRGATMLHELYHASPLVSQPQITDFDIYGSQKSKDTAAKNGTAVASFVSDCYTFDALAIFGQQYFNLKGSPDAGYPTYVTADMSKIQDIGHVKGNLADSPFATAAQRDPKLWIEFDIPTGAVQSSGRTCKGLGNSKWVPRDPVYNVVGEFCADAEKQGVQDKGSGAFTRTYLSGKDQVILRLTWPTGQSGWKPNHAECAGAMIDIIDNCDGNAGTANPMNWKHGGASKIGSALYEVEPQVDRGYRHGICSFHMTETETWTGSDSAGSERQHRFYDNVSIKGGDGSVVGGTNGKSIQFGQDGVKGLDGADPYVFNGLYQPLRMTPEANSGDYVQFNIGNQAWTTKDSSGVARCNLGNFNSLKSPAKRDMDCFFPC